MEVSVALRVVRGPDWAWDDQDGGEWHAGTVVESNQYKTSGSVVVQWDCGSRCRYRCGERGKYDLRVFDSAPTGMKFRDIRCSGCCTEGINGMVWKCLKCFDYHLCTSCYMAGKHLLEHRFDCIITSDQKKVRVPLRCSAQRVEIRGLFPGALVTRGRDWHWGNQDGGVGQSGRIMGVRGWSNETARSVVVVQWKDKGKKNIYRVGHNGKVDLKCAVAGGGGFIYPEHLPVLGAPCVPPGPQDFASGDRVKAELDMEIFQSLGEDTPEIAEQVLMFLDHAGTVNSILDSGDLLVRYPSNALIPVNPEAATKTDLPAFQIGDVVRILDDLAEAFRLQKEHGGWADDMALSLGQVGVVTKEFQSGDLQVDVNGKRWTFSALCLQPAPEESPPATTGVRVLDADIQLKLFSMSAEMNCHLVVAAAAAGDVAILRNVLTKQPSEVNVKYEGKTAIHAAAEEGRIDALKVLFEFRADLELADGEGERPLHRCAYLNQAEVARMLLDAGADINCRNSKKNTPLMISGAVGHYKVLKVLTEHEKLDLNAQDISGKTALHHAVVSQRTKSVLLLLDAGADPTLFNNRCFTPIHDAVGYGFVPAVEEFVTRFPQHVNLKRPADFHVPLHIAAANNRLDAVTLLARVNSCDINAENDLKRTPLHVAAIEGHCNVIERLVGFGADLNHVDNEGNTPLHVVFIKKNTKPLIDAPQMMKVRTALLGLLSGCNVPGYMVLACFLSQEGADAHIKNKLGHSPMHLCPPDMQSLMTNFVNQSSNSLFHGSLHSTPDIQTAVHPSAGLSYEDPKLSSGTETAQPSSVSLPGSGLEPTIPDASSHHGPPPQKKTECLLCDSPADVSFDPCGHCVLCSQCAGRAKRCPVCKVEVQTAHKSDS